MKTVLDTIIVVVRGANNVFKCTKQHGRTLVKIVRCQVTVLVISEPLCSFAALVWSSQRCQLREFQKP